MTETYQRVLIPMGDGIDLYGFVRTIDGEPQHTYCCQITPLAWVEPIGWSADPDTVEDWEPPEGGYFSIGTVKRCLRDKAYEYEDEEEAREDCQGNWC